MAETAQNSDPEEKSQPFGDKSSIPYLGLAFGLYLATAGPVNREMAKRVKRAEEEVEEVEEMRWRRKEDAKANARVVEIFASHRHAWQQEERRLHRQIHDAAAEAAALRARVAELEAAEVGLKDAAEELRREVSERSEMIEFLSSRMVGDEEEFGDDWVEKFRVFEEEESGLGSDDFNQKILGTAETKFWSERSNLWQV